MLAGAGGGLSWRYRVARVAFPTWAGACGIEGLVVVGGHRLYYQILVGTFRTYRTNPPAPLHAAIQIFAPSMLLLLLFLAQQAPTLPARPQPPAGGRPVYLCMGGNSHAYHASPRCEGLA